MRFACERFRTVFQAISAGRVWQCLRTRSTSSWSRAALLILSAAILGTWLVPHAVAQGGNDPYRHLLEILNASTADWGNILLNQGLVFRIYAASIILQFLFFGYSIAYGPLRNEPFPWASIYRQLGIIFFAGFVLLAWPMLGGSIQAFFLSIAHEATGVDAVSPTALTASGLGILATLLHPKFLIFFLGLMPFFQFLFLFILIVLMVALASVGVRALLLVVESYLLVTIGVIPFSLAPWSPTTAFADHYLRYAARLGIEWMLLIMIVHMGSELGPYFQGRLDQIGFWEISALFTELFWITVTAVVFAWSAVRLPTKFANELVHLWRPGLQEAMRS